MHFQRCFRYFSNPKTVRLPFQGDIGLVEKFRVFHHFREFGIFDLALSIPDINKTHKQWKTIFTSNHSMVFFEVNAS